MAGRTRFGPAAYGVRPYNAGAFAGKTQSDEPTPPIMRTGGPFTRFGEAGYGVRRYNPAAFANKTQSDEPAGGEERVPFVYRRRMRSRRLKARKRFN